MNFNVQKKQRAFEEVYLRGFHTLNLCPNTRMHPGARAMVVKIDQVPLPEEQKPQSVNVFTASLTKHRFLITSQELEVVYDMMSADYLLDMAVKACFDTTGTIKTEMTMRVIVWSMAKESKKAKLHKVDAPTVQEMKTVSFQLAECYAWDYQRARLRRGDDPRIRSTMDCCTMPEAHGFQSWKTLICFKLTRGIVRLTLMLLALRTGEQITADDKLFRENPRLVKLRQGTGTYGYCAWCDSSPTGLWNHYEGVRGANMQVAPLTPPSVWQTLLGRETGAGAAHFASPGRELKYWVIPAESDNWSSWIEGITRNRPAVLVGLSELNLTSEGCLPRVEVLPAVTELLPFQVPPKAIHLQIGVTEDYWKKSKLDPFLVLSIGVPITSDLAFMTMFNESGRIEGGLHSKTDEYGSERLYGPKRYPVRLRMLSKEVDDVLVGGLQPLDVLTCRVPHCSMPAPETVQMHVTTAYTHDPKVATACLQASLHARKALGLADCSTGPEARIFDHLWRDKEMLESIPATKGFKEKWFLVSDTSPQWKEVLHVDNWCDAQHVQRQGTSAENELLVMSRPDDGCRIWPAAVSALHQRSTGSSNAVKAVNGRFPWSGSGFDLSLGVSATYAGPGEDRTSVLAAAQSPSSMTPAKGTSSSATSSFAKDAGTSSMPPPSVPSSALTKAGSAVSAAGSPKSTADQVPAAKGPPAPKMSGTDAAKGPPSKPASDSAIMASSASKTSQPSQAIQGNLPTLAESMGKSGPPKKSPPQHPPKNRSSSLSLKAAYSSITSTATPGKGDDTKTASSPRSATAPISTEVGGTAPAASSKSGARTLEKRGQEMMSKKQKEKEEKDPGMSCTHMVLEAIRKQGEGVDWEEQKKKRRTSNVSRISAEISHTVMGVAPLPGLLLRALLNAQPYESPVEAWVEGMFHPIRKPGRMIVLPLPEAAGVFQWTLLAESDLQSQPKRSEVPLLNPDKLGIDTLIYFWERTWGARVPWIPIIPSRTKVESRYSMCQLYCQMSIRSLGQGPFWDGHIVVSSQRSRKGRCHHIQTWCISSWRCMLAKVFQQPNHCLSADKASRSMRQAQKSGQEVRV